jgi:hypothetical protein
MTVYLELELGAAKVECPSPRLAQGRVEECWVQMEKGIGQDSLIDSTKFTELHFWIYQLRHEGNGNKRLITVNCQKT